MSSVDFFSTLSSFLLSFAQTRKELVEREKRNARKKQQQQQAAKKAENKLLQPSSQQRANIGPIKPFQPALKTVAAPVSTEGSSVDIATISYPHLTEFLRRL
jgi:hypothetical protein